jgi:hypothetical protein
MNAIWPVPNASGDPGYGSELELGEEQAAIIEKIV